MNISTTAETPVANVSLPEPCREWLSAGRFALFLGALIFLAFPQVVTGFHSFVFRDYGVFGYPLAYYQRECFWRGELPLWNPYNNCGLPFLAQWNTMVLYPPSLIYLLLPLPWSLGIFMLLHQLFGGLGMYMLTCRWTGNRLAAAVAGTAFAFNGFTLNSLMWPHLSASLAWMPWVVFTTTRAWRDGGRQLPLAALAGALQMLSGTPEVIVCTWLIVGAFWFANRFSTWTAVWTPAWRCLLVVLLVAALAAAQLFPFLDMLPHTHRNISFDVGEWAVPPWGWANLFVPMFRTFRGTAGVHFQIDQGFTTSFYPGLAVIVLAALAVCRVRDRRVWLLAGLVVAALLLGMGERAHVYGLLRKAFPQMGMVRYTVKFLIIFTFAFPLLAAFGLDALLRDRLDTGRIRRRFHLAFVLALSVAATVAGIVAYAYFFPDPREIWVSIFNNGLARVIFLGGTLSLLWWLCRITNNQRRSLLQGALLMLLCVDLMKHTAQQNPTIPQRALTMKAPSIDEMQPRPRLGQSRVSITPAADVTFLYGRAPDLTQTYLRMRAGLGDNLNLLDRVPKVDGFFPMYLQDLRDLVHFRLFRTETEPRAPLARFLGISHITSPTNVMIWHSQSNYMPLVTAGQMPQFTRKTAILSRLLAPDFVPETTVYLPLAAHSEIAVTNAGGARVLSCDATAHAITAHVEALTPAMVVIAQTYYHNWRAFVNGRPVKLWAANYAFQALQVPAGTHRVELVYQDRAFYTGLIISLTSFVAILCILCRRNSIRPQLH